MSTTGSTTSPTMTTTTKVHPYGLDPAKIQGYAEFALHTLRANNVSDEEIVNHYAIPHAEADASFEAGQLRAEGFITAPAALVKQAIRAMVQANPEAKFEVEVRRVVRTGAGK